MQKKKQKRVFKKFCNTHFHSFRFLQSFFVDIVQPWLESEWGKAGVSPAESGRNLEISFLKSYWYKK